MARVAGSLTGFAQVIELPADELRRLLGQGDPVERLWASWALSLRDRRVAHPELVRALRSESCAGTRCLMATVLAGFGDRETLALLASSDAEPLVRETAAQLAVRVGGDDALTTERMLARMEHDPAPQVRVALMEALGDRDPEGFAERCAGLLNDPSAEVRRAAAGRIVALVPYGARLPGEVGRWLRALPWAEPEVVARVLDRWAWLGVRLSWDAFSALAARAEPRIDERLPQVLDPATARPALAWLLAQVLRDWRAETAPLALLAQVLAPVRADDLDEVEASRCRTLLAVLERNKPRGAAFEVLGALRVALRGAGPGASIATPRRRARR